VETIKNSLIFFNMRVLHLDIYANTPVIRSLMTHRGVSLSPTVAPPARPDAASKRESSSTASPLPTASAHKGSNPTTSKLETRLERFRWKEIYIFCFLKLFSKF
jgi:hypothetical protein